MNIFKIPSKEREKEINNILSNTTSDELLKELIECGLEVTMNEKEIAFSIYIHDVPMTGKQIIKIIVKSMYTYKEQIERKELSSFLALLNLDTLADIYYDLEYKGVIKNER